MSKTTTLKAMVVVRGNNAGAVRGTIYPELKKKKMVEYEAVGTNMYINSLAVFVHTLEEIAENIENGKKVDVQIFTVSSVMNAVGRLNRTKTLLQKAGKDAEEILDVFVKTKTSGEMSEEEVGLWERFLDIEETIEGSVRLYHMYSEKKMGVWEKQIGGKRTLSSTDRFKKTYIALSDMVEELLPEPTPYKEQEVVEDEALPI